MQGLWNATRPYVRGLPEAESRALHTRVRPCKGGTAESWGKEVSMAGEISLPCATRSPLLEAAAERALLARGA